MSHLSDERRQKPAATWEPVGVADLARLEGLVAGARRVEGDVAGALRRVRPGQPTGQIVTWAWVVDPPRRQVLLIDHLRPPERRAHHHWDRLVHHLRSREGRQQ